MDTFHSIAQYHWSSVAGLQRRSLRWYAQMVHVVLVECIFCEPGCSKQYVIVLPLLPEKVTNPLAFPKCLLPMKQHL